MCSAPNIAYSMCRRANQARGNVKNVCGTNHRTKYAPSDVEVICNIPLTCGRRYIGETGQCINERTREHANNLKSSTTGHLATHCRECTCNAESWDATETSSHGALAIGEMKENCISSPSILLYNRKKIFLRGYSPFNN